MPALRNSLTAQSTVAALDGKPEMRPHIWPLPISLRWAAARAKPTIVSTSALIAAPPNSGVAASVVVGLGGRAPTRTAGEALVFGGSATPNHGPSFFDGAVRGGSS